MWAIAADTPAILTWPILCVPDGFSIGFMNRYSFSPLLYWATVCCFIAGEGKIGKNPLKHSVNALLP